MEVQSLYCDDGLFKDSLQPSYACFPPPPSYHYNWRIFEEGLLHELSACPLYICSISIDIIHNRSLLLSVLHVYSRDTRCFFSTTIRCILDDKYVHKQVGPWYYCQDRQCRAVSMLQVDVRSWKEKTMLVVRQRC